MSKVVLWQMLLGTIGFLASVVIWVAGREPNWIIMAASISLLGGGAILQAGQGGERGK